VELPSVDDGGRRRATRWAWLRARVEGTRVPRTVPRDDATGTPDSVWRRATARTGVETHATLQERARRRSERPTLRG